MMPRPHEFSTKVRAAAFQRAGGRCEAAHIGAKAPSCRPLPGGKDSPYKIKIGGAVVRR